MSTPIRAHRGRCRTLETISIAVRYCEVEVAAGSMMTARVEVEVLPQVTADGGSMMLFVNRVRSRRVSATPPLSSGLYRRPSNLC